MTFHVACRSRHNLLRCAINPRVVATVSLTFTVILLYCSYVRMSYSHGKRDNRVPPVNDKDGCHVPDMPARHESILQFLSPVEPIVCSLNTPLTYTVKEGGRQVLRINESVVEDYTTAVENLDCCVAEITRVSDNSNRKDVCIGFNRFVVLDLEVEFIHTSCLDRRNGIRVYNNMHAVVQVKPSANVSLVDDVKQPLDVTSTMLPPDVGGTRENRPNVLLFGIDGVSRLSLIRNMPRTIEYLQANNWVELRKYNKIDDNTLPNLMAVLSDHSKQQLVAMNCWRDQTHFRDHCPYMWKEFKKKGYVTAYAEDEYYISTFNHNTKGFDAPPTDHYFRPFIIQAMKTLHQTKRDGLTVCLGPTTTTEHYLKYTKDLLETYDRSLFALVWLNNFSHDNLNTPSTMDGRYLEFFAEMSSNGAFDNTFVVFFSDHGARYGEIRRTYVGWLEERLPFIYVWVPTWFRERHPDAYRNLVVNGDRLTSPYDLHLALKDVLEDTVGVAGNGSEACPTCASLFAEAAAKNRTCAEAGVSQHWCTCALMTETDTNDTIVRQASESAVGTIMRKLRANKSTRGKCAELELNRVFSARMVEKGEKGDSKSSVDYVIAFDTVPGLAMFDVTIRYSPKKTRSMYKVIGLISRINAYGDQSECISDTDLKLYCYCINS